MSYRATDDSSSLTADERSQEAWRIYHEMKLCDYLDEMTPNARSFLERLASEDFESVSVKQLFWIRDLADRHIR